MAEADRQFLVDGETFRVRLDGDGAFNCEWLSGPNAGYGFASGAPGGFRRGPADELLSHASRPSSGRVSDDHVTDSIRRFLAMIDPDTGFIRD